MHTVIVRSSRHTPPSDSEAVEPVPWMLNVSKSAESVGSYLLQVILPPMGAVKIQ